MNKILKICLAAFLAVLAAKISGSARSDETRAAAVNPHF